MKKPQNLIYGVNEKPPLFHLCSLGLQHTLLICVNLILVAILVRSAHVSAEETRSIISMALIALAIGSSLQALWKGPIGSGFLAAPVISAIYLAPSLTAIQVGGVATMITMIAFSGFLEILFSRFLFRMRATFPPAIGGFVIAVVGIHLGLIGLAQVLNVQDQGSHLFTPKIIASFVTLITIISISIWTKGYLKLMCTFIGLVVGVLLYTLLGLISPSEFHSLSQTPLLGLPNISYIHYHFMPSLIVPFVIAAIAASLRTIGVITTCQKINDEDWKKPDIKTIKRGMLADSLACFIGGLIGSPGINTGPSLVGVSQASGATSRYVAFAASIILLIFAFIPKIGAFFLILPLPIAGAAMVFTASFMIVGGIQVITSRNIDIRMTYVLGIALLLGLSRALFPEYYDHLPSFLHSFSNSAITLSICAALLLNSLFRFGVTRKQHISVNSVDILQSKLPKSLRDMQKQWKLPSEMMYRVQASLSEISRQVMSLSLNQNPIEINFSYDSHSLVVTIDYEGELLRLPFLNQRKVLYFEEEAFSYGLSDFWSGIHPDKIEYKTKKNRVEFILTFAA